MITNEPSKPVSEHIEAMRSSFEFRATWMSLLIDAAEKRGLNTDFAREAIRNCGCFHGVHKFNPENDLPAFVEQFATQDILDIFEIDMQTTDDKMVCTFHYCPLVKAWQKLGYGDEKIAELCDIAMEGDRGILQMNDKLEFDLGDTIGAGKPTCVVTVSKVQ